MKSWFFFTSIVLEKNLIYIKFQDNFHNFVIYAKALKFEKYDEFLEYLLKLFFGQSSNFI